MLARPPPTLGQSKPLPCFQLGGCVVRWRLEFAALCLEIYDPVLANSSNLEPEVKIPNSRTENMKFEVFCRKCHLKTWSLKFSAESVAKDLCALFEVKFWFRRHRDFHITRLQWTSVVSCGYPVYFWLHQIEDFSTWLQYNIPYSCEFLHVSVRRPVQAGCRRRE